MAFSPFLILELCCCTKKEEHDMTMNLNLDIRIESELSKVNKIVPIYTIYCTLNSAGVSSCVLQCPLLTPSSSSNLSATPRIVGNSPISTPTLSAPQTAGTRQTSAIVTQSPTLNFPAVLFTIASYALNPSIIRSFDHAARSIPSGPTRFRIRRLVTGCMSQEIMDARVRTIALASGSEGGGRREGVLEEEVISSRYSRAARDWVIVMVCLVPCSMMSDGTVSEGFNVP